MNRAPLLALAAGTAMLIAPRSAAADDTIKRPLDHRIYPIEIEPHGTVAVSSLYNAAGVGAGVRLSVPVLNEGFLPKVNDSVAISFGGDFVHYDGCIGHRCGANYLIAPVVMQWNFFVSNSWSLMAEPGVAGYYGFFDDTCAGVAGPCVGHTRAGILPAAFVGARYHASEHVALTARIGFPTFSLGASFL